MSDDGSYHFHRRRRGDYLCVSASKRSRAVLCEVFDWPLQALQSQLLTESMFWTQGMPRGHWGDPERVGSRNVAIHCWIGTLFQ